MAQAKLTINDTQERVLGLLVYHTKTKYPILYDAQSGVNLQKTKPGEFITVPDGAKLLNLKKLQQQGCFSVIEGTVLARLAAFSSVVLNGTTLTLNFSAAVTAPQLTATTDGATADSIIVSVDGTPIAATFAAVSGQTSIEATIGTVTTGEISVEITQAGASKIFDANNTAIAPATNAYTVQ